MNLWEHHEPVTKYLDIQIPAWIDQDISPYDVVGIYEGGCASGSYIPAVTYYTAMETMTEHGNDVFDYLEEVFGEIPQIPKGTSWCGVAMFFLSMAVELWVSLVYDDLVDLPEPTETESSDD